MTSVSDDASVNEWLQQHVPALPLASAFVGIALFVVARMVVRFVLEWRQKRAMQKAFGISLERRVDKLEFDMTAAFRQLDKIEARRIATTIAVQKSVTAQAERAFSLPEEKTPPATSDTVEDVARG